MSVTVDRLPRAALAQMAVAVLLLGTAWPLTRFALLQGAGPAWFALGRAGFSGLVAIIAVTAMGRLRLPRRRDLPALLALGLLQLGGFFAFAHAAVEWVPAGRTALLANCTIVFTVPLSLLFLHEPISRRRWLATALGATGIAVLCNPWAIDWRAPHLLFGHVLLMGSALCWAIAMVVVRLWPPRMSMLELLPWAFALATLVLLPMALMNPAGRWDRGATMSLLAIGLFVGPVATWCVMQAQSQLPLVVSSNGFLAGPAFGVVLATIFLHEALGPDMIAGAGLILSGAALASTRGKR